MKDYIGIGEGKNIEQAISNATKGLENPKLVIFICDYDKFDQVTKSLHDKYSNSNVIGMTGYAFSKSGMLSEGVLVWGITEGIDNVAGVIGDLDKYPVKHIKEFQNNINSINGAKENTICLEFSTNRQERLSTTMNAALNKTGIELIGGSPLKYPTEPTGDKVSLNGKIYNNSCVYVLIKNLNGKVKVYKENLYKRVGRKMSVTKINSDTGEIIELNGKPALKEFYDVIDEATNNSRENIIMNSLCRMIGNEEYTLATDITNNGIRFYKELTTNDVVYANELGDYKKIIDETMANIAKEFKSISTIFTIDCLYRYFALDSVNYIKNYLDAINAKSKHVGFISAGEQYKTQFINQTMVCAVFE